MCKHLAMSATTLEIHVWYAKMCQVSSVVQYIYVHVIAACYGINLASIVIVFLSRF